MELADKCPLAKTLEKPADLLDRIKHFEAFEGIACEVLEWLIRQSEYVFVPAHADLYSAGMAVDTMDTIVQGRYIVSIMRDGKRREVGVYQTGFVTGVLPFSRMTHASAVLHCTEDTYVLRTHRNCFTEMVNVSYALVERLVGLMSNRIREFADIRSQDEKMISLGKLSAGLAHELNNPSSAIVRSAEDLHREIHKTPESFKEIMLMKMQPDQVDKINVILFARLQEMHLPDQRSAIDKLEHTESLEDWLDDNDISVAESVLESLSQARFTPTDLDHINTIMQRQSMPQLLQWLGQNILIEDLVEEIRESAGRISELVTSVKSYTHMDRDAGRQPLDVHDGLRSTLTMLKHKFKAESVSVTENFQPDLPQVLGVGGQLNQVYTNLIDNAIDAAGKGGTVNIRTSQRGDSVCVEIEDDGPGVPPDLQQKIFEPFFTTKDVGQGTGIGLDITRKILARLSSEIELESKPGQTIFRFCLPVAPQN